MLFRSKKDTILPFPTSAISVRNEKLTSGFLIFHEINITKYLTDVQKKLLNNEPISKDILAKIKNELVCKFIAVHTLCEPDRLSKSADFDFEKEEISFDLSKSDIPIMKKDLNKIDKIVSEMGEQMYVYSREVGTFFENKSNWEIKIYNLLLVLITRKATDKIPGLRNALFIYLRNYCDQLLSKDGICAVVSLKMIRNAMLENLGTMPEFYSECAKINNNDFNNFFNLEIKDELDLLFIYYAYVRRAVPGNTTLNLRNYMAYAANYILTQSVNDSEGSPEKCTIFHNIAKLSSSPPKLRLQDCRNKLNKYHKKMKFLYDLMFNNYRLIGQDRKNAVNDYLNFMNYVLSTHKRVEKYNIEDFIVSDTSKYYVFLSKPYSELILIQNIIPCKEDFNSFVKKFTKDYDNFELRHPAINSDVLRLNYRFADYLHAQTYEELYTRLQLNTPKGIDQLRKDTIKVIIDAFNIIYEEAMRLTPPSKNASLPIYPVAEAIKYEIISNCDDSKFKKGMRYDDIKNVYQQTAESIFIRLLYTINVNHDICMTLKGVKEGMCPVLMNELQFITRGTTSESRGHAYVKLLYNDEIHVLDPNVEYDYTENKDMSVYVIDHNDIINLDDEPELNSTQIMLFGSGKGKNKIIVIAIIAVIAIVVIVVAIVFTRKESFTANATQMNHLNAN